MRKTIKGILYDSAQSAPLCRSEYRCGEKAVRETAYRTAGGHYFVVQTVNEKDLALFPMSNRDMIDWTDFPFQSTGEIWPGPGTRA